MTREHRGVELGMENVNEPEMVNNVTLLQTFLKFVGMNMEKMSVKV